MARRSRRSNIWSTIGFIPLVLIYIPMLWLGLTSLNANPLGGDILPLTLDNYRSLIADSAWHSPFKASVILSVVVATCVSIIALGFVRGIRSSKVEGYWIGLTLIPLFVPGMVLGSSLFAVLKITKIIPVGNISLMLIQGMWGMPFAVLVLWVVYKRFDARLIEAAKDLGASPQQAFVTVELPLVLPGFFGAWLFSFLLAFNELERSLFVKGFEVTMPIYNWIMATSQQSQIPIIYALGTTLMLFTIPIVAFIFTKMFNK